MPAFSHNRVLHLSLTALLFLTLAITAPMAHADPSQDAALPWTALPVKGDPPWIADGVISRRNSCVYLSAVNFHHQPFPIYPVEARALSLFLQDARYLRQHLDPAKIRYSRISFDYLVDGHNSIVMPDAHKERLFNGITGQNPASTKPIRFRMMPLVALPSPQPSPAIIRTRDLNMLNALIKPGLDRSVNINYFDPDAVDNARDHALGAQRIVIKEFPDFQRGDPYIYPPKAWIALP